MNNYTSLEKAHAWAQNTYFSEESRSEIQKLINENNLKEIEERFYRDLEFGTGGMRSILGQGMNRINTYTIRRATKALCLEVLAQNVPNSKICISYDSRIMSFELAKNAAEVMAFYGIKAFIYKRLNPVALLSFAVRHLHAEAGVMVTASHNPPAYNGYKVFWNDGSQVTPPNDKNIINHYNSLTDFSTIGFTPFEEGIKKGMIEWMDVDIEDAYFEKTLKKCINPKMIQEFGSKLKIVYTPIHGAGLVTCTRALSSLGFCDVNVVPEQAQPDGRFPTVKSPNPENPEALKMSVDLMEKLGADIAMGSDPDTDRLGVALFHKGKVEYLNGNQIGILKLHYILSEKKAQGTLPKNGYFVKTIVTTSLQDTIAKAYGVETFNTLTGFKWICGKMNEIEKSCPEKEFLFATEESFGYLSHTYARDKDGVTSVSLMAEVALFYKLKGMDLIDALEKIYTEFGFSNESLLSLDYFGIEGQEKIKRIMHTFRNYKDHEFCGFPIDKKIDYQNDETGLPKSDVLGFFLGTHNQVYLRPSGTEPKIKFYIMIQEQDGDLETKKKNAQIKTDKILDYIKAVCDKA
jgi:phosphoglucomutase